MTNNEIVARWIAKWLDLQFVGAKQYILTERGTILSLTDFHKDYNLIHEAWVKFRDLKFINNDHRIAHENFSDSIAIKVAYAPIQEAFDELVRGIEWAESIKN